MGILRPQQATTVSGSPLEQPDGRRVRRQLEIDLSTVPMQQVNFLAHNPDQARDAIQARVMSAPQRMQAVSKTYNKPLSEGLIRLRRGFAEADRDAQNADPSDTQETPIERITNITHDILNAPTGPAEAGTHRYLVNYDLQYRQIESDQQYLQALAETRADLKPDLLMLNRALEELMRKDPKYVIRQFEKRHEQDNVDTKIYGALQGGVFIAAALATVLGLGVGIAQRKLSAATLLYAGVAFFAYPGMWDQFFGPKDKQMIKEINGSLNTPEFKTLRARYNVRGRAWSEYARMTLEDPTPTTSLISALRAHGLRSKGNAELEQQIDDYVQSMGGGRLEKDTMQKMIDNGDFVDFANILLTLHNEDAKAIAYDYIKTGAGTL